MKLFSILASGAAMAHAASGSGSTATHTGWQDASDADIKTYKSDVMHAAGTLKDIKNKSCQMPKGTTLQKLGNPKTVSKHFYKTSNGNTRSTWEFKFADGSLLFAGNQNVGAKGGVWKIYCYRAPTTHTVVTKSPHDQNDLSSSMINRLRSIFKSIDKDGSGTITTGGAYAGLAQVFPSYSLPTFEATLEKESIRAAGSDKVVDVDEFECVAKKLYNIQKVYAEFKQYDHDHNLKMSRKELESALIKFYFKDVAKPGLIQTAVARANVKKTVDAIMARHDKDKDSQVSWSEFEMDAFAEEHFSLGAKCRTSKTPLNAHEVSVVENLLKRFKAGSTKEMSHSMWYQVTSMLTEMAIDKINGSAKPPALGCMHAQKKPSGSGSTHVFGPNGGHTFGSGKGPRQVVGGRMLLARFLQPKQPKSSGSGSGSSAQKKEMMSVHQAINALHKQADSNHDGKISDHEILDIFQGVRDHLSNNDFGSFLDMVNKVHGPVNCGQSKDCGKCTATSNAGLCGWFAEASKPTGGFGGFGGATKSTGTCKFVDRSKSAEQNDGADTGRPTTCSSVCKSKPVFRGQK